MARIFLHVVPGVSAFEITGKWDGYTLSQFIQTDFDYPTLASAFRWDIRKVQRNHPKGGKPCQHSQTDGTIDCPECGAPAALFIQSAAQFLREHDGSWANDPGYLE